MKVETLEKKCKNCNLPKCNCEQLIKEFNNKLKNYCKCIEPELTFYLRNGWRCIDCQKMPYIVDEKRKLYDKCFGLVSDVSVDFDTYIGNSDAGHSLAYSLEIACRFANIFSSSYIIYLLKQSAYIGNENYPNTFMFDESKIYSYSKSVCEHDGGCFENHCYDIHYYDFEELYFCCLHDPDYSFEDFCGACIRENGLQCEFCKQTKFFREFKQAYTKDESYQLCFPCYTDWYNEQMRQERIRIGLKSKKIEEWVV